MELNSDKSCTVGLSPKTVLSTHRDCSNVEKRNKKGKPAHRDELLSLKEDFIEINFGHYRRSSCKSIASRPVGLEAKIELKRGSMYQSSEEVRTMKKMGPAEGGRFFEICHSSDTSFSYGMFDSCGLDEAELKKRSPMIALNGLDEEALKKRSPVMSLDSNFCPTSVGKPCIESCSSDGFDKICLNSNDGDEHADTVEKDSVDVNFRSDEAVGTLNNGNDLERDTVRSLHQSLSVKVEMPHFPSPSESDYSSRASSKARFGPIRNMFDPFKKSKSLRSPLGYIVESGGLKKSRTTDMGRSRTSRKSLLRDFSNTAKVSQPDPQFVERENHCSVISPVHLHGCLKLKYKHGVPFFELSLKCPEDVVVAKAWKTDNAFKWVYTFHSINGRKMSNASVWGWNGSNRDSSMVGQMQVSRYLCSELKDGVFYDNSVVTEFVLYDIARARQSIAAQENGTPALKDFEGYDPRLFKETFEDDRSHPTKLKLQQRQASEKGDFDSSNSYPWTSAELHSNLEIAAIVIQVPFEMTETSTYKRGDKVGDKLIPNLLNHSMIEQKKEDLRDGRTSEKVKVLIPTGSHGLPSSGSGGPSSLVDRWRLGGGCDCGGWDMACPLTVLGNPCIQFAKDKALQENRQPLELFVQGAKENTPALTMTFIEEGEYSVDFHAQLSTLQAFSICVSILHSTEATDNARKDRNIQLSQNNSLKVFIDDGVKFLIETDTTEEKKKVNKIVKEIPPSYFSNPPFSPISRV
ncbi:hypothetical protein I3843_12G092700 [Carya illinoinensis]|uniref:Uncharacterized protein n=2 Tax=Carya illinoinensis TaxID=32201 RepID=A0A8T1NR34_CARIL|nr:uncharacterized protein LOC122289817 isoform X1 [Carya illinoinensis]XP_042953059.1 uncharacterized protein LOC122289817 isoform X1 [Carya illinoinensis]KAG6634069.1 hypothetical protein CIPAW_12G093200 [Carya illinoinensis]KAG6685019.1 hypothetical protein I3842_12G091800 [Carya illinoinensis]KAG6685020.1 hypothetical protein I3842_12G091800 [Carya illinoinensis]KAG6685021.1 hypothetical protein I3842_12G091800 [Carya illinoinensis]KAG7953090.1 hypothetical protein I3843_12G092700 [Carya 